MVGLYYTTIHLYNITYQTFVPTQYFWKNLFLITISIKISHITHIKLFKIDI